MTLGLLPSPLPRCQPRPQLVLQIEFDDAAGFRSSYLSDASGAGIRIATSMQVGQRFFLSISSPGCGRPLQIEAVVQWSLPDAHPDGPAAGLTFIDPSPEATAWLGDALEPSTETYRGAPVVPLRVLLLEAQPFLREIYGQEVHNWAELRGHEPLELVALADPAAWLDEVARRSATLAIMDVDGLPMTGLDLHRLVRAKAIAAELPLILLGSPAHVAPVSAVGDELLCCLGKPLRFGVLMNRVRALARDPLATLPRRSAKRP
jgi:hypothetical protein